MPSPRTHDQRTPGSRVPGAPPGPGPCPLTQTGFSPLYRLMNRAWHGSLRIYSEEMGDTTIEDPLISAARRGVDVQVCGENTEGEYDSGFSRLAAAGGHISYYSSPHGLYIHGKVIEADYGTGHAKVFIGSGNFSSTSLNRNRELGLITAHRKVLSAIASTFGGDYRRGTHCRLNLDALALRAAVCAGL